MDADTHRYQIALFTSASIGVHRRLRRKAAMGRLERIDRGPVAGEIACTAADVAAHRARVKRWEFEPTLLNGKPVSVIVTVAVQFSL